MNPADAEANKVTIENQMWCYIWYDMARPLEIKFGERWVFAGQIPKDEVTSRVRAQQKTSKHLFDDGSIVIAEIWNVSEYAKKVGRFFKQSRVDDVIRIAIRHRIGTTGEFHSIAPEEAIIRVNKELAKFDGTLPEAGLSTLQYKMLEETLDAFDTGHIKIMAELCARFGKTIWAGSLIVETQAPITVIASYVLTVFSSFIKDLTSFEQFAHLVHVDSAQDGWEEKVKEARKENKQVVIYLSMCGGNDKKATELEKAFISKRNDRIRTIYNFNDPILLIIDEADFGVHTESQARILVDSQREGDKVVLMTGTNADRAASLWAIDYYQNVVYPELLMMKKEAQEEL